MRPTYGTNARHLGHPSRMLMAARRRDRLAYLRCLYMTQVLHELLEILHPNVEHFHRLA